MVELTSMIIDAVGGDITARKAAAAGRRFYPDANETSLRAVIEAANVVGGGSIIYPNTPIVITSPLPMYSFQRHVGNWVPFTSAVIPDNPPTFGNVGSVIRPSGNFPAFSANNQGSATAKPAVAGPTGFQSDALLGWSLENMVIEGGSRGIDCGSQNLPGLTYGLIQNNMFKGQSEWSISLPNRFRTTVRYNHMFLPNGLPNIGGFIDGSDVPLGVFIPGNSTDEENYIYRGNPTSRGRVRYAKAGSIYNELYSGREQVNGFGGAAANQTATFTSGSPTVQITDASKYPVGMPVYFATTQAGFTANLTYMVLSSDTTANTITIGNSRSSAAISASASTTATLQSNGMPNFEFVAEQAGGIQHSTFSHMDVEGYSTAAVYIENVATAYFRLGEIGANQLSHVVVRTASAIKVESFQEAIIDLDGGAGGNTQFFGVLKGIRGRRPNGMWTDFNTQNYGMSLRGGLGVSSTLTASCVQDIIGKSSGSGNWLDLKAPFGSRIPTAPINTATTLDTNRGGTIYVTSGAPLTLPTIVNANEKDSILGFNTRIVNIGTVASAIGTDGTQTFNTQAGKVSVSLPASACLEVTASIGFSGALFWGAVLSNPV